jgi:two-component system CheB/CheR fusion protein
MHSPFAFAILKGKDKQIILANDSIKAIWGKGKHVVGKPLLQVLPELKEGTLPGLIDEVYATGVAYSGYEVLVPLLHAGKLVDMYFNFVFQPYLEADETISGVTVISYEVTAHVMAKNELIEAKKTAEQRRQVAEDAVKSKQQFLSNMSHEIRTPMNAILGFTNVVLKTKLDAKQREYISAVKASGDTLIVLINDILDLAKVDAGKMTFEQTPFNLRGSLSTLFHLFEAKAKEQNIALLQEQDATLPDLIKGDPMRLRQILINLVGNAIKFTPTGYIKLSVSKASEDEDRIGLRFAVEDTGIGIHQERLAKIFNDFEQAGRDTSRTFGGTGLGLAIVKQLVELQGGNIEVISEPGKGSTFAFTLHFAKCEQVALSEATDADTTELATPAATKQLKVLVAEDVALNQLLIKIILLDFGFTLDIAANGKIAIEKLRTNTYDIVLMDLQMPEMNGFEATTYIRNELHSQIPIIALTADVTKVDVENCKAVGMNDYISKPINEKLLLEKILACMNG